MRNRLFSRRRPLLAACAMALLWGGAFLELPASAEPSSIKIAVFDFELDDFSGGAGIAGDHAADLAQLDRTTSEARRLIAQSGRYGLVDVANAESDAVKGRALRQCNGCEADIALKLGADQSFVGVVTRISRTEYVVPDSRRPYRRARARAAKRSSHRRGLFLEPRRGLADQEQLAR